MFTDAEQLYKSKVWEQLREQLYNERLNDKSELICKHCDKPIVLKYDAILHHIIELTNANVNDVSISLNPDNLIWVHHKCHNEIHCRWGFNKQLVFLVYGASCSGKSTYVKNIANKDDLIVDLDTIWEMISINDRYNKPNTLKAVVFSIRDELYDVIKMRKGKWHNAYVIVTMPRVMERKRLCDSLGAKEIFVDTDKETCIKRLKENPSSRDIKEYEEYINDFFNNYQPSDVE